MNTTLIYILILSLSILSKVQSSPWDEFKKSNAIVMGEGESKITISLIEALAIHGRYTEANTMWGIQASDHGFLYTKEGDLFIDNLYAGNFDSTDTLHFKSGRFWVNGLPKLLVPISQVHKSKIYDLNVFPKNPKNWKCLQIRPYKIFIRPVPNQGGGRHADPSNYTESAGMTNIRVTDGSLYVQGINYGPFTTDDVLAILEGAVYINDVLKPPHQAAK